MTNIFIGIIVQVVGDVGIAVGLHEYEIDAEAPRVAIEITEYEYFSFLPERFEPDDGFCGECNQHVQAT